MSGDGRARRRDGPAPEATSARLSQLLAEEGCDALVVVATTSRDPDLAFFVGAVHLGQSILIGRRRGAPLLAYLTSMERGEAAATGLPLIPPEALHVVRRRAEAGAREGRFLAGLIAAVLRAGRIAADSRLALAGRWPAGALAQATAALRRQGWRLASGDRIVRLLRKRKTAGQMAAARAAAAGTCAAMRAAARLLAAGRARAGELWLAGERLSAGRLRREIAGELSRLGLEQPEGNIVAGGRDAGMPHSQGADERVLAPGEAIVVDLFPRRGLFADCTRTLCVGRPPEALARAHAAVAAALAAAHRRARPGARGWDLQEAVCAELGGAGYPTLLSDPRTQRGYVHGLGHGVGYELHELPSFRREAPPADGTLEAGDLFTLEPGLYDPEAGWGVRLEDLCWMAPGGPENLTPLPADLDPRTWSTGRIR